MRKIGSTTDLDQNLKGSSGRSAFLVSLFLYRLLPSRTASVNIVAFRRDLCDKKIICVHDNQSSLHKRSYSDWLSRSSPAPSIIEAINIRWSVLALKWDSQCEQRGRLCTRTCSSILCSLEWSGGERKWNMLTRQTFSSQTYWVAIEVEMANRSFVPSFYSSNISRCNIIECHVIRSGNLSHNKLASFQNGFIGHAPRNCSQEGKLLGRHDRDEISWPSPRFSHSVSVCLTLRRTSHVALWILET